MEQREKLIELLLNNPKANGECFITMCNTDCKYYESDQCYTEMLADHLIANGVVVMPCRCCECEYNIGKSVIDGKIICVLMATICDPDDFCSGGERKGGDE